MFSASKTSGPSGYNLTNSLRFRSSASASLTRTPASNGNRQIFTMSFWVKRGTLSAQQAIITQGSGQRDIVRIGSDNSLYFYFWDGATYVTTNTTQVFRDPSAWYHIVIACDTTQATAANRIKLYVNGSQVTAFANANYPSQNFNFNYWNTTAPAAIGKDITSSSDYYDGYVTEYNFIDGQALTPSSFGSTNATTGVWQPAKYTGTYGTNGFYLNFSNIALTSGSNTGLGKDYSGNGNYWNTNNISVTAGTTYDSMTDVPTLTSATVANYAVMNPLSSASGTLTNGNLTFSNAGAVKGAMGTFGLESGKWYWENTITTLGANDLGVGILFNNATAGMRDGTSTSTYSVFYQANTNVRKNGTIVANYASYTTGDIIGIAYNADTLQITFYKNNVSQGTITADSPSSPYVVWIIQPNTITATVNANFGQQPFTYTPPTGYLALNTYNLPTSTIVQGNKYMDATTYSGTGSSQSITNTAGFKPDLVWIKTRSTVNDHRLVDSVRGVTKELYSNQTYSEGTDPNGLTAFNSNGFTVGSSAAYNGSGVSVVGWQWQAGQGSTSSNTSGSITSTVSVNASAGFSIVTYTGTGANATVGHGLGVAPKMVIVKQRSGAGQNWAVYHASLANTGGLALNLTNATITASGWWNNTSPTSSVFSLGGSTGSDWFTTNQSGSTYVAYCWAEIAGFSKFGSYTGNGSTDGPFVYLGFRPKFIMIKDTTAASANNWIIFDSSRNTYNQGGLGLYPNLSNAEDNGSGLYHQFDFVSNGIKFRSGTNSEACNQSGETYIYAAFAENPFKNSLAR